MHRRSLRIPAAGVAYLVAAAVTSSAMASGPQEFADVAVSSGTRAAPVPRQPW